MHFFDCVMRFCFSPFFCLSVGDYKDAYAKEAGSVVPDVTVVPDEEYVPHSVDIYTAAIDIQPPEDFVVEAKAESDADLVPEVLATHKPFIDTAIFQHVDTHALEVSKFSMHLCHRELSWDHIELRYRE
jgi:hypothetical protein